MRLDTGLRFGFISSLTTRSKGARSGERAYNIGHCPRKFVGRVPSGGDPTVLNGLLINKANVLNGCTGPEFVNFTSYASDLDRGPWW